MFLRFVVTNTCVGEPLSDNGLLRLSGVISLYVKLSFTCNKHWAVDNEKAIKLISPMLYFILHAQSDSDMRDIISGNKNGWNQSYAMLFLRP
jgi:hypothetical protein